MARDLMDQVIRQRAKVTKNANNKRKWEGDHVRSSSQQQNKRHKVIRAHAAGPSNKKGYAETLPHCHTCTLHHTGPCTVKCNSYRTLQERLSKMEESEPCEPNLEGKSSRKL
ncbi:hypothetical protein Tco_1075010 [Tanacetum coccineum]